MLPINRIYVSIKYGQNQIKRIICRSCWVGIAKVVVWNRFMNRYPSQLTAASGTCKHPSSTLGYTEVPNLIYYPSDVQHVQFLFEWPVARSSLRPKKHSRSTRDLGLLSRPHSVALRFDKPLENWFYLMCQYENL